MDTANSSGVSSLIQEAGYEEEYEEEYQGEGVEYYGEEGYGEEEYEREYLVESPLGGGGEGSGGVPRIDETLVEKEEDDVLGELPQVVKRPARISMRAKTRSNDTRSRRPTLFQESPKISNAWCTIKARNTRDRAGTLLMSRQRRTPVPAVNNTTFFAPPATLQPNPHPQSTGGSGSGPSGANGSGGGSGGGGGGNPGGRVNERGTWLEDPATFSFDGEVSFDEGMRYKFVPEQFERARACIEDGNLAKFRLAVANINVNMRDEDDDDNSLLHWAVGYNNVAMARELLTLGASNLSNNLGTTPLELAVQAYESGDASFFDMKNLLKSGVALKK